MTRTDSSDPITPSTGPRSGWKRAASLLLALFLSFYGIHGLIRDDLFIPAKRGAGFHLHGASATLMFVAFLMAAMNLISIAIDDPQDRAVQRGFRRFAKITQIIGWSCFALALVAAVVAGPRAE